MEKKIEDYKGISIYEKPDLVGGHYYHAPTLTTEKCHVNFAPSLKFMKELIDIELYTKI